MKAATIASARQTLAERYRAKLEINPVLNRSLVSYQSNRKRPFYRWFKCADNLCRAVHDARIAEAH